MLELWEHASARLKSDSDERIHRAEAKMYAAHKLITLGTLR
jgi:hypothetical protein